MKFLFKINTEGIDFIKNNKNHIYPNVEYDENCSTITLDLPEPDRSTIGQFMTVVKEKGLLIGKNRELVVLTSSCITEYPYKLEAF